jgi:hypothetical protein
MREIYNQLEASDALAFLHFLQPLTTRILELEGSPEWTSMDWAVGMEGLVPPYKVHHLKQQDGETIHSLIYNFFFLTGALA